MSLSLVCLFENFLKSTDVTFGTLESAEALQSKTLFSHCRPVSGGTGHWVIWKRWFEMESGRKRKESVLQTLKN